MLVTQARSADVVFRDADLGGGELVDVRIGGERVLSIDPAASTPLADGEIDCDGGYLLPGLHDHHIHLMATAAALESVRCDDVRSLHVLHDRIRVAAPRDGWIRVVGYDDGVLGQLDRYRLDEIRDDVPMRVQHRSGALWVVNSRAVAELAMTDVSEPGVELDAAGAPTGRLWRMDAWLRARLPATQPDLTAVGAELLQLGITGVTDASPNLSADAVAALLSGAIPQRVVLLGDPNGWAPWKIVIADHNLPSFATLAAQIEAVRPRSVALHSVTRESLALAIAVLRAVGAVTGDRIEHAAVCSPAGAAALAELGVAVVTQPSFVARRGDDYLDRVDSADRPQLWPFASLLAAGVAVGCGSDSPYGSLDPWSSIVSARDRSAPSGRPVALGEAVPAARALAGYLSAPDALGGPARSVTAGAPADLVLLDVGADVALRDVDARHVRLTMIGGRTVYRAEVAVPR